MNSKNNLILIGGGGHCKACIDVIEQEGKYKIFGILDKPEYCGEKVLSYPILGTDDEMGNYVRKGYSFLVTVGQIKNTDLRKSIFNKLKMLNAFFATIISPLAKVSKYAEVGEGTIILHGVFVNAGSKVGINNILNTGCNIEHDVTIGNHCHVSTNAIINGDCIIGEGVLIGSNAVVSNGIGIISNSLIGAGAVVIKNIDKPGIFVGNPAKEIRRKI